MRLVSISQVSCVKHGYGWPSRTCKYYDLSTDARARKCETEVVLSSTSSDKRIFVSANICVRLLVRSLARIRVTLCGIVEKRDLTRVRRWTLRSLGNTVGRFGKLLTASQRKSHDFLSFFLSLFLSICLPPPYLFLARDDCIVYWESTRVVVARDVSTRTNVTISYGTYKFK